MSATAENLDTLNTLRFHKDNFAILRASAIEDNKLARREQRPLRRIAQFVLAQEDANIAFRDRRYLGLLAGMVEQFAERTEFAVVDLASNYQQTRKIAEELIEERRARGEAAEGLARMLHAEAQWLELVDGEPFDIDTWSEMWQIEGGSAA